MRPLDLGVQLQSASSDVRVPDTLVLDMPVELCLKLMDLVRSDGLDEKRKLLYNMIDEVDGVLLIMFFVDFLKPEYVCHRQ